MSTRFLQIHSLTSYPAALLNRDDAGFAKRIPFGGATRTRVSSQCLKRHWRRHQGPDGLDAITLGSNAAVPMAIRSRRTFESMIFKPLVEEDAASRDVIEAAVAALLTGLLGSSAKAKAAKGEAATDGEGLRTGQVTVLGNPEIAYFRSIVAEAAAGAAGNPTAAADAVAKRLKERDFKKNLETIAHHAGLDSALFGRMVTSDILARCDASVHVAHAFTVHAEAAETDYFSAVDDLPQVGDDATLGSGHIGSAELTSGLFYGYVVVDLPLLVSNLTGSSTADWQDADRGLAAEVVRRLVRLIPTVSPGAKLGSTAPYAHAHAVLVEAGDTQPRTLANAFLRPVRQQPDVIANAYADLAEHLRAHDAMYGRDGERRIAAMGGGAARDELVALTDGGPHSVGELAGWAAAVVAG